MLLAISEQAFKNQKNKKEDGVKRYNWKQRIWPRLGLQLQPAGANEHQKVHQKKDKDNICEKLKLQNSLVFRNGKLGLDLGTWHGI